MASPIATYDVVIVGAGPVGLLLSVALSRWGYKVKHIDNRPVPTFTGRADGIQPRTLEILKNMGLKSKILAWDAARVFEVAFWDPAPGGKIVRTGTWPSCPDFIDARYPYTALLHQGLIERTLIDDLRKNGTSVERPATITKFDTNHTDPTYPVQIDLKNIDTNVTSTMRARYLFSGEGARSFVRDQLGVKIRHKDPISHVWGVMDGVVRTNFPDIKMKCTIHSDHGSIMVIPRENNMVRLYIQIASSTDKDFSPRKTATVYEVQTAAKKILQPYTIIWDRVEWYSVYPIGQGIADKYTLDGRVFMGGDVCHTHSPKAGQGMNTAFHDAINLAWKIHLVESGFASRSILDTYEVERKHTAETLLDFDNKYAALFSERQKEAPAMQSTRSEPGSHLAPEVSPKIQSQSHEDSDFIKYFKANCEFTSGFGVAYLPNVFNYSRETSNFHSHLIFSSDSELVRPGRTLPHANVTRVSDAHPAHLEDSVPFTGAFRLFVFGGTRSKPQSNAHPLLSSLATALLAPNSFYSRFSYQALKLPPRDLDHGHSSPHSPLFSVALTLVAKRPEVEISNLPTFFQDYRNTIFTDDSFDRKVAKSETPAHAKMGLESKDGSSAEGGIVVVRPDGHVGIAVKLLDGSVEEAVKVLERYFENFLADSCEQAREFVSKHGERGGVGGLNGPNKAQL